MVLGKLAVEKKKNQVRPSSETTHGLTFQIGERTQALPQLNLHSSWGGRSGAFL